MASRTTTDPIEILLEMGVDLDNLSEEEDYLSALKEAIATIQFQTKGAGDERSTILQQEVVKVRKQRKAADPKFKARKTKISADVFKKGSAAGVNVAPKALPTSAIVPYQAPEAPEAEEGKKKKKKKEEPKNLLAEIATSVTNIADILKDQYNLKKREGEFDRKKAQRDKRKLDEKNLEKGFGTLFKSAQKIIKPVQGFFDKIFNFIKQILIGKFLIGLVNWISKPENQKKLFNIIDFLGKHWKKLLSLYLIFGTGLGRFVFGLTKVLISGAIKLGAAIAKLLAVKGLKRFAGVARFLGGSKGRLIATGAATALTVGGTMAGLGSLGFSGGGEVPQVQGYAGGGTVEPSPTKEDGPLNFIMNMSGAAKGAALGSLLGPLGTLAGAGIGSLFDKFGKKKDDTVKLSKPAKVELEVPSEPSGTEGEVDGPGGTDKVPAMLTAGEFVMSRGAVQKYGVKTLESMNAAGGGTNQPKIVNNKVYASVGGYVGNAELGKKGTPDPEKDESSGDAGPSMGYRLGQINPMQDLRVMEKVAEKVVDRERRGGQGGRKLGSTTQRAGEGTKIYKDGHLVTSYDKYGRKKEYGKPEGFMRALAGLGDLLTGNLFDFDRRNEKNVGISESRIVTKDFKGSREYIDDTTTSKVMSAIGRPDLIEHQDQILKQLPKGTSIQDVIKGNIPGVTPDQLTKILATSDAQKATRKKQDDAIKLDLAIRGIGEKGGSMMAGDMTPALRQAEATANKRHAELMKSTNPEKITAYDKEHGQGAYSQKLKEKLYRTYGAGASGQTQPTSPTPTGQVVGRENLPSNTQKVLARMDAQKAGNLPPNVKTSGPLLGRMAMGMMGGLNNMMSNFTGGITNAINNPKSIVESMGGTVKDGNIGTPTAQEQKDFDNLAASKAKLKQSQQTLMGLKSPAKSVQNDPLFAEYQQAFDNPNHPLHDKVAGDLFTDKDPIRFADFKKLKAQQAQVKPPAKVASTPPKVSAPEPPQQPAVSVVKMPGRNTGGDTPPAQRGGSRTPEFNAGSGSSSKRKILGIF